MERKVYFLTAVIIVAAIFVSADFGIINASDDITKKEIGIGKISSIKVSGGIDLYISRGGETSLTIESNDNLQDYVKTEIDDQGNVKIKFDSPGIIFNGRSVRALLCCDSIGVISCSGGSDVKGEIGCSKLYINLSGGSDAKLWGSCDSLILKASGGCDSYLQELSAAHAIIDISGASDASVNVSKTIRMKASGASDIYFSGEAKVMESDFSGASDLRRK